MVKLIMKGDSFMFAFGARFFLMTGILFTSFYIFSKSIRYTASVTHKALMLVWCLLWALSFAFVEGFNLIPLVLFRPLVVLLTIAFIIAVDCTRKIEEKEKSETLTSAYLIAFGLSYVFHYMSVLAISVSAALMLGDDIVIDAPIDHNQPIYILLFSLIAILQIALSILFFKIRRIKNGFPFIFNKYTIVVSLIFTGAILAFVTWVSMLSLSDESRIELTVARYLLVAGALIIGIGIYILIRRLIRAYQNKLRQQHAAKYYENKWKETTAELEDARATILTQESKLHDFEVLLREMKTAVKNQEATLSDVENLEQNMREKTAKRKSTALLPSAKSMMVDRLFKRYAGQCFDDKIEFHLMINGNIKHMVEDTVSQNDLEILINNLLRNAQIAVNASDNVMRSIAVRLGVFGNHYEFTVMDSGIPFEVNTLQKLGTARVTTHKSGSGIGFESTFETLNDTGASLVISEKQMSNSDFTKTITVRFDDKNQYIIETYRPGEFAKSDRYLIKTR